MKIHSKLMNITELMRLLIDFYLTDKDSLIRVEAYVVGNRRIIKLTADTEVKSDVT